MVKSLIEIFINTAARDFDEVTDVNFKYTVLRGRESWLVQFYSSKTVHNKV